MARVISVGTTRGFIVSTGYACELENGQTGEKRMRCVSVVSRNGCKFIYGVCFGNGRGRIISYFKPRVYIYISNHRKGKKKKRSLLLNHHVKIKEKS